MTTTVIDTEGAYQRSTLTEVKAWVDLGDDWMALTRFAVVGRDFVLAEVRGFARDGKDRPTHWSGSRSGVRTAFPIRRLQRLSLLDVQHHVERQFVDDLPEDVADPLERLVAAGWSTEAETPRDRWALTALTYALAVVHGAPAPTRRTAEIEGREYSKVRDDLHAARRAGFLTAGSGRGGSGGELTDEGWKQVVGLIQFDKALDRYRKELGR